MGNSPSHPGAQPSAQRQHGSQPQRTGGSPQPHPSSSQPQAPHPHRHPQHPWTPAPQHAQQPASGVQPAQVQPPPAPPPWQPYYNYPGPSYYQYPQGAYPPGYQYPHAGYQYPYPAGYPQGQYWHPGTQTPLGAARPPGPAVEHVKEIQTVRNPVNVKRSSVRLEPDEQDPKKHLLCFTFDATVSGRLAVFYVAREGPCCSFSPVHPDLYRSPVSSFEKGLNQKFKQSSDAAVDLSLFPEEQLGEVDIGEGGETFPLVICLVSHRAENEKKPLDKSSDNSSSSSGGMADLLGLGGNSIADSSSGILPGQALDLTVQAQMTYAVIKRRAVAGSSIEYGVSVVKQRIWVDGAEYDLQEIYGMEGASTGEGKAEKEKGSELARDVSTASDDTGTECVICLSAPRSTTVLPCRHMCMCGECADVLRFQSNKCPICRHTVEGLLQIKISQKKATDEADPTSAQAGKDQNGISTVPPPPPPLTTPPPPQAGGTQEQGLNSFLMGS